MSDRGTGLRPKLRPSASHAHDSIDDHPQAKLVANDQSRNEFYQDKSDTREDESGVIEEDFVDGLRDGWMDVPSVVLSVKIHTGLPAI